MINVRIFREHQKKLIIAFIINFFLFLTIAFNFLRNFGSQCGCGGPLVKDRSKLKQIGTTVAIYFSDQRLNLNYPKKPVSINIESYLVNQADQHSWESISETSPYFFLVDENDVYTGSATKPLAIGKVPVTDVQINNIVFEDGHVESRSIEETKSLIGAFYFKKFIRYTLGKEWIKND